MNDNVNGAINGILGGLLLLAIFAGMIIAGILFIFGVALIFMAVAWFLCWICGATEDTTGICLLVAGGLSLCVSVPSLMFYVSGNEKRIEAVEQAYEQQVAKERAEKKKADEAASASLDRAIAKRKAEKERQEQIRYQEQLEYQRQQEAIAYQQWLEYQHQARIQERIDAQRRREHRAWQQRTIAEAEQNMADHGYGKEKEEK